MDYYNSGDHELVSLFAFVDIMTDIKQTLLDLNMHVDCSIGPLVQIQSDMLDKVAGNTLVLLHFR